MNPVMQYFLLPLSPVIAPVAACVLLIAAECFTGLRLHRTKFLIALAGACASIFFSAKLIQAYPIPFTSEGYTQGVRWLVEFGNSFYLDPMVLAFFGAIAFFTLISLVFLDNAFKESEVRSEIFALTLIVSAGMMLLVSANSLVMIFLALELLSLPTYVLVGIKRKDRYSSEAALKYFLFGSFATVLLVLAVACLYAAYGTMSLAKITEVLREPTDHHNTLGLAGILLFLTTVAFKVGAVPFHMWVPDAYQGAPTPVTGFMGSAVKLAAFGLSVRVFWGMLAPLQEVWVPILSWIAVLTMLVGNLAALMQDNLKRLFAYSSIAHAGYLLLALCSVSPALSSGSAHIFYYLFVYGVMFLGFFGILMLVEQNTGHVDNYSIAGLGFSHPLLGGCMAIFALSAAGIPPTAGFFAKYFIFQDAIAAGNAWLVVIAVLSSVIGAYYYLRILVQLYMKESEEKVELNFSNRLVKLSILLCALFIAVSALSPVGPF